MNFYQLSQAERDLLAGAETGVPVDLSGAGAPSSGANWGANRTIRAALIVELCTTSLWPVASRGVHLKGARITGCLDFEASALNCPLRLIDCWLEEAVNLCEAETKLLQFSGSYLPGIRADRVKVKGSLAVDAGFICTGTIHLRDGHIEGSVVAGGAQFLSTPRHLSIVASRASVQGGFFMDRKFRAEGAIDLIDSKLGGPFVLEDATLFCPGRIALDATRLTAKGFFLRKSEVEGECVLMEANIDGTLDCEGSTLRNPLAVTLRADGLTTKGAVLLRNGFNSIGCVRLAYAKIGATLHCDNATLVNPAGDTLSGQEITTGSSVTFRSGFQSTGTITLSGSNIGGTIRFTDASSIAVGGTALNLSSASVKRELIFSNFTATGKVDLFGISTGGNIEFVGGALFNPDDVALRADRVIATGGIHLLDRFSAVGEIRMVGARVGTAIEAPGATITNPDKLALVATGVSVVGGVQLQGIKIDGEFICESAQLGGTLNLNEARLSAANCDFALQASNLVAKGNVLGRDAVFDGGISLLHARIGGEIDLEGSQVSQGRKDHALYAGDLQVGGGVFWRCFTQPAVGGIDLRDAKIGQLYDDVGSWPRQATLRMHGFEYGSFGGPPMKVSERLSWLRKQIEFSLAAYEQVIRVLRRSGHDKEARQIAYAKQEDLRHNGTMTIPARLWNRFLGLTIGHGYYIHRAVLISCAVILLGGFVFNQAYQKAVMVPIKDRPEHYAPGISVPNVPQFNPVLYSADVFVPIINFHQEEYWLPVGPGPYADRFRLYLWIHILCGWTLTTLVVSGLTGLVKKD